MFSIFYLFIIFLSQGHWIVHLTRATIVILPRQPPTSACNGSGCHIRPSQKYRMFHHSQETVGLLTWAETLSNYLYQSLSFSIQCVFGVLVLTYFISKITKDWIRQKCYYVSLHGLSLQVITFFSLYHPAVRVCLLYRCTSACMFGVLQTVWCCMVWRV